VTKNPGLYIGANKKIVAVKKISGFFAKAQNDNVKRISCIRYYEKSFGKS
jgi:hypothetical protein